MEVSFKCERKSSLALFEHEIRRMTKDGTFSEIKETIVVVAK